MTNQPDRQSQSPRSDRRERRRSDQDSRRRSRPVAASPNQTAPADRPPAAGSRGPFKKTLSTRQLEQLCHRLGRSLKAGIPIARAWENETRLHTGDLRGAFEQVQAEIADGGTAADAVAEQKCFPPMFAEMVRVGEETGRLDEALLRLADHYRNLVRMHRTMKQALTWPVLQSIAAVVVITVFFLIAARLESTMAFFRAPDVFMLGLPPLGNLILFWGIILGIAASLFVAVKGVASGWLGRLPVQMAMSMPLLGQAVRTLSLSRFAWSFGTAVESGMDAKQAIRLAVRSTQNHYYTVHEESIAEAVHQGNEFFTALDQAEAFPEELVQAVQVGELTGDLPESLDRLSDDYREQSELSLRRISQVTGFMVFSLVAALTGTAVILMYANYMGTLNEALTAPMATAEQIEDGEKTDNPIIAARNEAVRDFVENNEDYKKIQSTYEHLQNINTMTPDEFLDGF